jgi:ABC-type polysaccharide/polyol phosphate transport system ATPase subunit
MPVIEVSHLTKEYRLGALQSLRQTVVNAGNRLLGRPVHERPLFKALNDVSFTVESGEVVGIIGHNGAGKSTLLKMLARISTPTGGTVQVSGRVAPLIEVGAGFVPDFTGRENVYLNGAILGMSKAEIARKFDEIVDFAEMAEFIDTPVKRYSSGMHVKLAFAVATHIESEILIVDEVLAVGDLAFQQKCIERMDTLIRRDGRTVLVVSHNIRQIERLCTRAMLLDHGRLVDSGAPRDVCGRFFRFAQERTLERLQAASGRVVPQRDAGLIEVLSVELVDDAGNAVNAVAFHESATLRIRFRTKTDLRRPELIVGFHTSDFVQVLYATNAMTGEQPDLDAGEHDVRIRFADLPLRPFSYGLRVIFLDAHNATLWSAENVIPVLVTPGRADVTKFPSVGLTFVPTQWTFDTLHEPVEALQA